MEAMNKPRDAVSHVPRVILYGVEKVSPHCGGRVTQWGWATRAGLHSALQKSRQRQCSVGLRVMGEGRRRMWGRGDSNSHASRHMILNHARLPIPTLPHEAPGHCARRPARGQIIRPANVPVHAGGRRECWGAAQRSGACLRLTHLGRGCKVFRS